MVGVVAVSEVQGVSYCGEVFSCHMILGLMMIIARPTRMGMKIILSESADEPRFPFCIFLVCQKRFAELERIAWRY